MPTVCCVLNCKNRGNRGGRRGYFRFPAILYHHKDEKTITLCKERRKKWLNNVKRKDWTPTAFSKICSDHFISGRPSALYDTTNPDWVPTQNLGFKTKRSECPEILIARYERQRARHRKQIAALAAKSKIPDRREVSINPINQKTPTPEALPEAIVGLVIVNYHGINGLPGQVNQIEIKNGNPVPEAVQSEITVDQGVNCHGSNGYPLAIKEIAKSHGKSGNSDIKIDVACQKDDVWSSVTELELKQLRMDNQHLRNQCHEQHAQISSLSYTEESFMKDEEKLIFYTGLTLVKFKLIKDLVGHLIPPTVKLTTFQRLFMFLLKIKLDLHCQDIAYRFNVANSTVTRNFHSVLKVIKAEPEALKHLPPMDEVTVRKPRGLSIKRDKLGSTNVV